MGIALLFSILSSAHQAPLSTCLRWCQWSTNHRVSVTWTHVARCNQLPLCPHARSQPSPHHSAHWNWTISLEQAQGQAGQCDVLPGLTALEYRTWTFQELGINNLLLSSSWVSFSVKKYFKICEMCYHSLNTTIELAEFGCYIFFSYSEGKHRLW